MSTISVPLTPPLEQFINSMIKTGRASNKAEVVRRALVKMAEDEAVEAVMRSMREVKAGKILRGNLDELAKNIS
ncbi:type II toxin-antitoxin system ParD family antitoxin [Candidatus Uhrbacteria bacterium]|nr:type II toxin-antitoxin system ParD family antitoxin [Candidatus Uhrbacteria bacterium]